MSTVACATSCRRAPRAPRGTIPLFTAFADCMRALRIHATSVSIAAIRTVAIATFTTNPHSILLSMPTLSLVTQALVLI
ncbi:unnamed protein product [Chondrus crispus]|uniref:Uncharacterized protein n=1 Tax=Chondrus crispus TaxID=2769 RepID=R7Q8H5_CHOCR|nr:unnamed protein product [Chondrus crispus]CDF34093.1 unnamed protein product [Chondrus crispus]|eukprot:XP_005713912.1 unnamed protein product [Chondrus crispus]